MQDATARHPTTTLLACLLLESLGTRGGEGRADYFFTRAGISQQVFADPRLEPRWESRMLKSYTLIIIIILLVEDALSDAANTHTLSFY